MITSKKLKYVCMYVYCYGNKVLKSYRIFWQRNKVEIAIIIETNFNTQPNETQIIPVKYRYATK